MSNTTQSKKSSGNGAKRSSKAPTTEKVRDRAHEAIDTAADRAEGMEDRLRKEAAETRVKLNQKKDAAQEQFEDSLARLEAFIKDRPLTATGIAFAAGIVASRLIRR